MVQDLALGLLLIVGSLIPALSPHGTRLGEMPARSLDAVGLLVLALECLPLALRRTRPALSLALVSAGFAADQLRGYHFVAGMALLFALVSAGAHVGRRRRATLAAFSAGYVGLAVALSALDAGEPLSEYITFYLLALAGWGMGVWLRSTRAAEEERRRRIESETLAAERDRIARELHDVVTHHVTAMVVQAEAARYLTATPDRLDGTLAAITDTGRRAISDLRNLLDLLNPDHGGTADRTPHSGGGIMGLVEQTRQAGQPVEFTEEGPAPQAAGSADLVVYRVVQEALTNALKYAHGRPTAVQVQHGARDIVVEVSTDGVARRGAAVGGSGRGLAGLRERVDVLGGEFTASPRSEGGFVVRARVPAGSMS